MRIESAFGVNDAVYQVWIKMIGGAGDVHDFIQRGRGRGFSRSGFSKLRFSKLRLRRHRRGSDGGARIRGRWHRYWYWQGEIFFVAGDLLRGHVREVGIVAGEIEASRCSHHQAMIVADGEAVAEDSQLGASRGTSEQSHSNGKQKRGGLRCNSPSPMHRQWSSLNHLLQIVLVESSQTGHDRRCANLVNDYWVKRFSMQRVLDGGGYTAFGIRAGKRPAPGTQLFRGIPHDKRVAGKGKHFNVVIVITNGHDLFAADAPVVGPALQRVPLGTAGVEHIDNRKIAAGVLGTQNCDGQAAASEDLQYPLHVRDRAAEHGLHGIAGERILDRNHELDVLHVLLQPALDAAFQMVQTLEHNGARSIAVKIIAVKGQNRLTAKFLHHADKLAAGRLREQVAMESFSGKRPGDGAIRTDQPEIKSQLLSDGQGKSVAAPGDQDDLDALGMHAPERCKIGLGNLEFWIEQGAVNIDGDEAEASGGHTQF